MSATSRMEAMRLGLNQYETGKSCRRGHYAPRSVPDGTCTQCRPGKLRKFFRDNPDKRKRYDATWYALNRATKVARTAQWQRTNPDANAANSARNCARRRHPGCIPANFDVRATVPYYAEARRLTRETGIAYEVDHIVPLSKGGMHAAYNLQVITRSRNLAKADTLPPNPLK